MDHWVPTTEVSVKSVEREESKEVAEMEFKVTGRSHCLLLFPSENAAMVDGEEG